MRRFLLYNFCYLIYVTTAFAQSGSDFAFNLKLLAKLDADVSNEAGQLSFSPSGKYFAAVNYKQSTQIWETAALAPKFSLNGKITAVYFSPDEKRLAVFYKNEAKILETESGKIQAVLEDNQSEIRFFGWSPGSQTIAVGTKDFAVKLFSAENGKIENSLIIHEKKKGFFKKLFDDAAAYEITAYFSPDGKKLLTNCGDPYAELWDLETGKLLFTFENALEDAGNMISGSKFVPASIMLAKISSDGKWIITSSYNETRLWNAETGVLVDSFRGFTFPQFSPNGLYLGVLSDSMSRTPALVLDLTSKDAKFSLPKYSGNIVAWSPNSRMFITDQTIDEGSKNNATIWDMTKGVSKAVVKTYSKGCFDPVSTCLSDWDKFTFSPNSRILMAHNNKEVKFFNPENGALLYKSEELRAPASWSSDGKNVLAGAKEKGKILLYEVSDK